MCTWPAGLTHPINLCWIIVDKHVHKIQGCQECIDPHANLLAWIDKLLKGRDKIFGVQTNPNAKHLNFLVQQKVFASDVPFSDPKSEEISHATDHATPVVHVGQVGTLNCEAR